MLNILVLMLTLIDVEFFLDLFPRFDFRFGILVVASHVIVQDRMAGYSREQTVVVRCHG